MVTDHFSDVTTPELRPLAEMSQSDPLGTFIQHLYGACLVQIPNKIISE